MEDFDSQPNEKKRPAAKLKGVGDSLWVTIDANRSEDEIKEEISQVFQRLNHLAVGARIIIDPGKTKEGDKLVDLLGKFLKKKYQVGSVCLPPEVREKRVNAENRIRQRDLDRSWYQYSSDVLMLTGRVRSGQKITARKHLLLMGDVNPGGEVFAGGDILILGCLRGTAWAGQSGDEKSIILAFDFRPTQVQIAGYVAAGTSESSGKYPEFAHVENGTIIVEDYMEANPFGRLPWPKVR
ncbi:MAG: septum site-determining protein MinC [Desulfobacterales bacterium]